MAFTLAEVLITLGIIGVVAAMTIPNLMYAYKAQQLRSRFLKSYSTIQQVFRQMIADEVSLNPNDYVNRAFQYEVIKHLKGASICTDKKGCYIHLVSKYYKSYDGRTHINPNVFDDGQIILPDGTLLIFENPAVGYGDRVWVHVDLNGYGTPPDRAGYDVFTFQFLDGEILPMGAPNTDYNDVSQYCNKDVSNQYNGLACAYVAKDDTEYFKRIVKQFK